MVKKIVCLLLCLGLAASLLCGCKNRYIPKEEYKTLENLRFKTEFSVYPSNVKTIKYSYENVSDETDSIGDGVGLIRIEDNNRQHVAGKKKIEYRYVAIIIEPGKTHTGALDLEEHFYLPLEPGTYCLCYEEYHSEPFEIIE